jgi:hypothetical protein
MIAMAWFLAICPPYPQLARCDVIKETAGQRQCLLEMRALHNPRARCFRIRIDHN